MVMSNPHPQELEAQTLDFSKHVDIAAPLDITWESVLLELGPESAIGEGKPMPFVLEAWPGGRWFRDLGNDAGHLWGHVQVIKPPALLEICGPMFMSYAATSHVQYRLTAEAEGTRLKVVHTAFGLIPAEHREGMQDVWLPTFAAHCFVRLGRHFKGGTQKFFVARLKFRLQRPEK